MDSKDAFEKWCAEETIVAPDLDYMRADGGTWVRLDGFYRPRALRLIARWMDAGSPYLNNEEVE